MVGLELVRKPVLVWHVLRGGDMDGYCFINFFLVHIFRGCCRSRRQVGVGGEGMGEEGRAGGMVRRGGVAGGLEEGISIRMNILKYTATSYLKNMGVHYLT